MDWFEQFESPEGARRWEQLLLHDGQWRAFGDIARLIQRVRKAITFADYRNLQLELGTNIMRINEERGIAKQRKTRITNQVSKLEKNAASSADVAALKAQLDHAETEYQIY